MPLVPHISIIIPLFNEEAVLPELTDRLNMLLGKLDGPAEIIFVDDGSRDNTGAMIQNLSLLNDSFVAIQLSRNFGHAAAITAGLEYASASDYVMIMDGDLQDPPEMLSKFIEKADQGYDVVYAVRKKRKEPWLKRVSYYAYYRLLKRMSGIDIPLDSGDFCLLSRRAVDVINQMPERSRFVRGIRAWIGFNQVGLEYEREERKKGNSKYSFNRLLRLAFDGIFNFSDLPVRFIFLIGLFAISLSLIYLAYALVLKLFYGQTPQGFTGLLAVIVLFSGVQLASLGIIGEYVLRIFFQTKNRPLYVVKRLIKKQQPNG